MAESGLDGHGPDPVSDEPIPVQQDPVLCEAGTNFIKLFRFVIYDQGPML